MPEYSIGLPDGRTMKVEATSEREALDGVQQWWTQQQAPAPSNNPGDTPAAGARAAAGLQSYGLPDGPEQDAEWRAMGWLPPEEDANAADFAQKVGQGFFSNFGDEIAAAAGSLPNLLTGGRYGRTREEILREVRARERNFDEEYPGLATAAEVAGGLGSAIAGGGLAARAAGAAPGFLRSVGSGVAASAPLGAADAAGRIEGPADGGTYVSEAGKGALISGALGGVTAGLGNLVGRAINPIATREAMALDRQGVDLTPGELLGQNAQRYEDALAAMPFLGNMVRNRAQEGVQSLNRRAYEQVLAPLGPRAGQRYMRGAEPGHGAIDRMTQIFNRQYGRVVPRLTAEIDTQLAGEINAIRQRIPEQAREDFQGLVDRYIIEQSDAATNRIPGTSLQGSLEGLREMTKRFQRSTANPYHQDVSTAARDLRESLTRAAERHSAPADVNAFRRVQSAYRRFRPVRDAAGRVAAEGGVFTPAMLHSAVRAADDTVGHGAAARGTATLQGLSSPARAVMKPKAGGSPTAERMAIMSALTGGGAIAAYQDPKLLGVGAAPAALIAALYSRPGRRAFQRYATGARRSARDAVIRRAIQASALPGEVSEWGE